MTRFSNNSENMKRLIEHLCEPTSCSIATERRAAKSSGPTACTCVGVCETAREREIGGNGEREIQREGQCVCERENERERERERGKKREGKRKRGKEREREREHVRVCS